jgi:hypothetical protein
MASIVLSLHSGLATSRSKLPRSTWMLISPYKEKALSKMTPLNSKAGRYRADDQLMRFLKTL